MTNVLSYGRSIFSISVLHHSTVDYTNKYGSACEFFSFFCTCLCMVNDTKSCVGDWLVWDSLRLAPTRSIALIFHTAKIILFNL